MKLLHIDSSILGPGSVSRELSAAIVKALKKAVPGLDVTARDLGANPLSHIDGALLAAGAANSDVDPKTGAAAAESARALDEFLAADIVVIGAPMYNFTIPSQLKSWIDRILIAGKTFRYTANGPEGLAGDKKVLIASSRGGFYSPGHPAHSFEFAETYLRAVFRFIGINEIEIVRAEGVAVGPAEREQAMNAALHSVHGVVGQILRAKAA